MNPIILAALAAATLASSPATSAVTAYTDLASFTAAAGALDLETVNGLTAETSFQTVPLSLGGGAFTILGFGNQFDGNFVDLPLTQYDIDGTTNLSVFTYEISGFDLTFAAPITAFGFDFAAMQDLVVRLNIEVAGATLVPPVQAGNVIGFYGFVSTTPFTTIRFVGPFDTADDFAMDNLRWTSSAAAIPEPATWALLIAGFGLTGASLRLRNCAPASPTNQRRRQ